MTQPVSNELIFLLRFHFNVVLVSFWVEMTGHWSIQSLLLPLLDMLEIMFLVEWSICDESILVGENELLVVNILSFETQVLEFCLNWTVFVNVGIDSPNTVLVGSVQVTDGLPDFLLDLEVILEVIDNLVVLSDFDFIVILVEL